MVLIIHLNPKKGILDGGSMIGTQNKANRDTWLEELDQFTKKDAGSKDLLHFGCQVHAIKKD